jgi:ABC-type amino acid transport substrate-binding protein
MNFFSMRRKLVGAGSAATVLAFNAQIVLAQTPTVSSGSEDPVIAKIKARGSLQVGVYNDNAPFNLAGKGIDVEIGAALAAALGVKLALLPFDAGENMDDDLRNMVWRGHYLGYGPADVLMHVPVDAPLISKTPQALIFAPYYRETLAMARLKSQSPEPLTDTRQLANKKIAVPGQSLAGWLLLGADDGAYRNQMITKLKDGIEAAQLLMKGEVAIAAGMASELEAALGSDPKYSIDVWPSARAARNSWAVGLSVKKDSVELAKLLQAAINDLSSNGSLATIFKQNKVEWRKP